MKVAQIAPLAESVPPKYYGGSERIVSYLTEELVRQGHEVTLFASGDSRTSARLVPCAETALRFDSNVEDPLPHHLMMVERVWRQAEEFDLLHFHIDLVQFPMIRRCGVPALTTLHGRLDLPDLRPFYAAYRDVPVVSISDSQRRPLEAANWAGTVHHGLPAGLLRCGEGRGGYLAFLGRISPEKRPDRAIEIAVRADLPLKIAAKVDKVNRDYWQEVVEPMVRANPNVEYIGEIGDAEKSEFLGNALGLLFPIDWPEPFGLVLIEAMACGTPVIAFRCGSVPELIDPGVTGWIVDSVAGAVEAVSKIGDLDRKRVRECFERRFTAERMALDYVRIYRRLTAPDEIEPALPQLGGYSESVAAIA